MSACQYSLAGFDFLIFFFQSFDIFIFTIGSYICFFKVLYATLNFYMLHPIQLRSALFSPSMDSFALSTQIY